MRKRPTSPQLTAPTMARPRAVAQGMPTPPDPAPTAHGLPHESRYASQGDTHVDDENRNTVQQYVGDMLALESHIEEALDGQLREVEDDVAARELHATAHLLGQTPTADLAE